MATRVARVLRSSVSLAELRLHTGVIGDAGAMAIAAAVVHARHLHVLRLESNRIGPVGAGALATALLAGCPVRHLDLCQNPLGPEGVDSLAVAVADAPSALLFLDAQNVGAKEAAERILECAQRRGVDVEAFGDAPFDDV